MTGTDGSCTRRVACASGSVCWLFQRGDEKLEVNAPRTIAGNDSIGGMAAGLAGLGIVYTSTFQAHPHIASGARVPLLPDWCAETIPLYVVYPPNRHRSTKVRVFVDWVVELFARRGLSSRRCCPPRTPEEQARIGPKRLPTPAH